MSTGALLHLRVRHEPGALTRIVSILNPFSVTELSYAVEDDGLARASVRLDADTDVVARVQLRLARLVPVLEVSPRPEVNPRPGVSPRPEVNPGPEAPPSPVRHSVIVDDDNDPANDSTTGLTPICA